MGVLRVRNSVRRTDEKVEVYRRADHRGAQGARGGDAGEGVVPAAGSRCRDAVPLETEVWGMEVSEARRLHALEDENRRLKRIVADLALDNAALKDVISKNWSTPRSGGRLRP